MNSTRRGTKQRRLAGVAVLLLGLIGMIVGFLGTASTATAEEPYTNYPPCDVEFMTVPDQAAWTETIEHPAIDEVTEQKMTDPGQPYIAPTEDSWTGLSWYVWTGGPRDSAPALDDDGWNDVPALPNGLPHDPVPATVYNVSHGESGLGSWFKYDGTFIPGTPGQAYIAPTYETVVITEGKAAWTETINHPATTKTVKNPNFPCDDPWVAGNEEQRQTITQPNCEDETIVSWQERRTRTETSEGVWGDWTAWVEVPNTRTTLDMTEDEAAQFCPDGWVAGSEMQLRDVEAAFDCEVDPVPTWVETRTRTETSEGVWGEWTEWVLVEGSEGSRPVTAAEALSCADVAPSESVKPTPQGPKDPQGPKPVVAPTVLGVEAQAPAAAVPTAVDAGVGPVSPAVASQGTNLWMLAGGMLVALGMALGFVPMPARGKHGR